MNARESENYLPISRSSSASKKCRDFLGRDISGTTFLGPNLVSFNRILVPYEISRVNAQKKKFLSVSQKRFNKLKNINISTS